MTAEIVEYLGKQAQQEEVLKQGQNYYDLFRALFDTTNSLGLIVRRLNFSTRVHKNDRLIEAEFDIEPEDTLFWLNDKYALSDFFKDTQTIQVGLRILPDTSHMNAGGISINLRKKPDDISWGGILLPSGEVVPRVYNEGEVEKSHDQNLVHSISRLLVVKLDTNKLRPGTLPTTEKGT